MKLHILSVWLLVLLLGMPAATVFADGDHGSAEDGADDHGDETSSSAGLMPLFVGIGVAAVVSAGAYPRRKKGMGSLQIGILGLTVATGVLHLVLGLSGATLMLLNGIGYLALAALLFLPIDLPPALRRILPILLIIYTLITIVGYFLLHTPAQYSTVGIVDKVIEVVLVIALGMMVGQADAA